MQRDVVARLSALHTNMMEQIRTSTNIHWREFSYPLTNNQTRKLDRPTDYSAKIRADLSLAWSLPFTPFREVETPSRVLALVECVGRGRKGGKGGSCFESLNSLPIEPQIVAANGSVNGKLHRVSNQPIHPGQHIAARFTFEAKRETSAL